MSSNADNLQGQTVMVVGASSGIGQVVAHASNQRGAHVILSSRSKDKLEAVRDSLANPEQATVLPFDYLNLEEVRTQIASLADINHGVCVAMDTVGEFTHWAASTLTGWFSGTNGSALQPTENNSPTEPTATHTPVFVGGTSGWYDG